ncbi:response regulator [Xylophilus sp. Kf1]|nr:response regulator [Xylophilus sp. Kf1]
MNILIVDDDAPARRHMRHLLARSPGGICSAVEEAADATRAAGLMRHKRFDLVLLDIHMPGQTGLQLADALRDQPRRPAVVFVTGHAQHALQAFEADAIDYITKPVRPERLARALVKAAGRTVAESEPDPGEGNSLHIVQRGRVHRVRLSEVLYIRAARKRLTVVTGHGTFELDGTLTELEARFEDQVLRVHRHTLVVMSAVTGMRRLGDDLGDSARWMLGLRGTADRLPVARRMVSAVRERLRFYAD